MFTINFLYSYVTLCPENEFDIMFAYFYLIEGKGKGCLAKIIGFASPLLQQKKLPPSFIPFYTSVSFMF